MTSFYGPGADQNGLSAVKVKVNGVKSHEGIGIKLEVEHAVVCVAGSQ